MQALSFARSCIFLAAIILAVMGAHAASEGSRSAANYPVTKNHRKFLNQLLNAVAHKDAAWIAGHTHYPLIVETGGNRRIIRTAAKFADVLKVKLDDVLVHRIQKEAKEPLFSNYQGVMVGDGVVWFCGEDPDSMGILAFGNFAWQP